MCILLVKFCKSVINNARMNIKFLSVFLHSLLLTTFLPYTHHFLCFITFIFVFSLYLSPLNLTFHFPFLNSSNPSIYFRQLSVFTFRLLNLLKSTGYVMHQQFNIQQLYVLLTLFCIYLRTNSDLCHLQHKLIGSYNREEKCLLRGTDRVFK